MKAAEYKLLTDLDVAGKRVFVRADLNVPIGEQGVVLDDMRIQESVPTIRHILDKGGTPIVASHLGDIAPGVDTKWSLRPLAEKLEALVGKKVHFASECVGPEARAAVESLPAGEVLLLENLRFHPGEKKNDPEFSKQLSILADVYVNDAFATAHRTHASIVGLPKYFTTKGAGLLMDKELSYFRKVLASPGRPLCIVLGGTKAATKMGVLGKILDRADKIIIGGALANTFLAAQGIQVGRSSYEYDLMGKAIELLGRLARKDCKVYLPVDVMVGTSPSATGFGRAVPTQEIPADTMILDIGPASALLFKEALTNADTIIWNGPMGAYENEEFSKGTFDLIEGIAAAHGLSIAAGGDSCAAIQKMALRHKFNFISTGGSAFLALLEDENLPGLEALAA